MQAKLLRVIQDRCVRPVGATEEVPVDLRFLSATHRDLAQRVADGLFREDLYYRIDVISLHVPPLRERREDIPLLAEHLLAHIAADTGIPAPKLGPEALAALAAHDYPGNVRELENILERALAYANGDTLQAADIRPRRAPRPGAEPAGPAPLAARRLGINTRQLRYRIVKLGIEIPPPFG
jgi:two-component system response regulator PilR (NtrC family)